MPAEVCPGQRFRTLEPIDVICWWWYDTVAILEDYSDRCEAVLPAGEAFTVREILPGEPESFFCDLGRARKLKRLLIPRGCQFRMLFLCRPTPYVVEIDRASIEAKCEVI